MAVGIENAGIDTPKKIKVRGKEMSVKTNQKSIDPATLGASAAKLALSFLPGSGEVIAAEDYFKEVDKFQEAQKKGDVKGMTGAGIMGFLAGVGTLPIIGYGPRIIKGVYKGGKDIYNAFRTSRANKGIEDLAMPEANEIEELTTSMLPVIQESRTVSTLKEKPSAVPIGDTDIPTGFMQEDVPFYSRGLEVLDNLDYKTFAKSGTVERIRPTLSTKDESLTAAEWSAIFKKNRVPQQELNETGVQTLLDTAKASGERVDVNTVRQLFIQNPIRNVTVAEYGGPEVAKVLAPLNKLFNETAATAARVDGELATGGAEYSQRILDDLDAFEDDIGALRAGTRSSVNAFEDNRTLSLRGFTNQRERIPLLEEKYERLFGEFPELKELFDTAKAELLTGRFSEEALAGTTRFPRAAKFEDSSYTLPGGDDYGEFVFKAKVPEGQKDVTFSQHFPDEENPIAHVRFDTRKIVNRGDDAIDMNEGDEVLFIQELQSDIHQKARTTDMMSNPEIDNILSEKVVKQFQASNKDIDKTIKGLAAQGYDITPEELNQLQKLIKQESENIRLLENVTPSSGPQGDKMPFAPLQGEEAWADYVIKFMANKAYQGGKKWLAIAPADVVSTRDTKFISEGNARFYGTSDLKSVDAAPRYDPRYPGEKQSYRPRDEDYKTIKSGEMVLPKILKNLSKIDPKRDPAKITTITINTPDGPQKVLALEIDDRFDRPFMLYKRSGGIVSLPIKW